jgi:hypothetical protein
MRTPVLAVAIAAAVPLPSPAQRYEWREVLPATHPPGRGLHGMVYDEARRVVLLFGGKLSLPTSEVFLDDTWQFDSTNWTELRPATVPPARGGHAMAYDPIRASTLVIGGVSYAGETRDAWEWDGSDWRQITIGNAALAADGAACYDAALGGVLYCREAANLLWDGVSWRTQFVTNPQSGSAIQVVYNPVLGGPITLLWGVTKRFSRPVGWVDVFAPLSNNPVGYGMACDPVSGLMVVTGGSANNQPYIQDTLIGNRIGWTKLVQTIPGRRDTRMVFDSARRRFVLFGGFFKTSGIVHLDDTWELHVYDQVATWTAFGQGCGAPPARLEPDPLYAGRPILGSNLTMLATLLPPGQPFVHAVGASDSLWLGQRLPLDLGSIGAPGCALLVSLDITDSVGTSRAAGDLRFTIRVPDALPLAGARFFHQLIGLAPGLNPAGLVVTNAGSGRIGVR